MVGISPSTADKGILDPAILWLHQPSKLDLPHAYLLQGPGRENVEENAGKDLMGSPGSDVHHFCSYSVGQNSVTGPHRAARGNVV